MADPSYIDPATNVLTDPEAWVAIASTTLGSDSSSISFTSPDDGSSKDWSQFMDIVAIMYWRGATSWPMRTGLLQLNGDTSAGNYVIQTLFGNGSSVTALIWEENGLAYGGLIANTADAGAFSATITTFFDINSGKHKSFFVQNASDHDSGNPESGHGMVQITMGTYKKQAPITQILFKADSGDVKAASRIDLFGILPRMVA
jgi:hypothetical protein